MTHDDHEAEGLAAQVLHERRYRTELLRSPDCRDPDHPGCSSCEPDDSTTNED